MERLKERVEKALAVGVYLSKRERPAQQVSLEELVRLAETSGAVVCGREFHELCNRNSATYIGKGLVQMVAESAREKGCNLVLFNEDLSPSQNRNLEEAMGVEVIDRTGLILDIFAQRARTSEGKLQVELAQLNYLLPRLSGKGKEFSQLAGGIGTRGPGETKLEMDRRKARAKIGLIQEQLKRVRSARALHRTKRTDLPMPLVAIVGYTNAGKSTLMNRLTDAGLLVEDKLFATLDPTVRRLKLPSGREILLEDTVGFINKLPHQLVEAFSATFEEVASADLLIHLVDSSDPNGKRKIEVVEHVLEELDLQRKPVLMVFNKIDEESEEGGLCGAEGLRISALKGEGIDRLLEAIEEKLSVSFRHLSLLLPYQAGRELSLLYRTSRILKREDRGDGIHLEVEVDEKQYNQFRQWVREDES